MRTARITRDTAETKIAIDLCLDGYILNLSTLADDVNYIRYEEDWWATQ